MSDAFYQIIAPMYDLEFARFNADLELYLGYAGIVGGPILEPGCGTGRLLIPLAEAGYEVIGVDASPAMVERAHERIVETGSARARVEIGDMRRLEGFGEASFHLVFIALNSFLHLLSRQDQLACLRAVRRVLHPNGIFIVDVFHPTPATLQAMDDRFAFDGRWSLPNGDELQRFSHRRVHPAEQLIETVLMYDHLDPAGAVHRTTASYTMRYVHRFELEGLIDDAGLAIEGVYGDYGLDPLDDASPQLIVVAHRA
jgi:SAM-dependent methyltransferase